MRQIPAAVAVLGLTALALVGCAPAGPADAGCERVTAPASSLDLVDVTAESVGETCEGVLNYSLPIVELPRPGGTGFESEHGATQVLAPPDDVLMRSCRQLIFPVFHLGPPHRQPMAGVMMDRSLRGPITGSGGPGCTSWTRVCWDLWPYPEEMISSRVRN